MLSFKSKQPAKACLFAAEQAQAQQVLRLTALAIAILQASQLHAQVAVQAHSTKPHTTAPANPVDSSELPVSSSDIPQADLAPIVVEAEQPTAATQLGTPASITAQHLHPHQAASSDTATILSRMSGINVQPAGGISALPVMRGLADNRIRIQVDGVDAIASCPNSMNSPLSYVDPTAIAEAKVYTGVTPVSVGGNSIAGSIVVNRAQPVFTDTTAPQASGRVGGFYRSNGDAMGSHVAATLANDSLSLQYTGSYAKADNHKAGGDFKSYTRTGNGNRQLDKDEVGSTAYESKNQSVSLAYRQNAHQLQASYTWQHIPYENYPNQRMDMLDNRLDRVNLTYDGDNDWGKLQAQLYHEDVRHYMNFGEDKRFWYGMNSMDKGDSTGMSGQPCSPTGTRGCANGMPMNTDSTTYGINLKGMLDVSATDSVNLGMEYQQHKLDDYWPASGGGMMPNTFENINNGQRQRVSLYGEWEKQHNPLWMTQLGIRYDNVRTDADAVHGYNAAGMEMMNQIRDASAFNASERQQTDHNIDLTAISRHQLSSHSQLELGLARKTRTPSLYERYTWSTWPMAAVMNNTTGDGNGYFGDPNLKPEVANTLSASIDWRADDNRWGMNVTPYYTHINDYIDAVQWQPMMNQPAASNSTQQYNVLRYSNQKANIYGVDLRADTQLADNDWGLWSLNGTLSYARGENSDTDSPLYHIMPLNGSVALQHSLGGWQNQVQLQGVSKKDRLNSPRNEQKTPGYALLNLRTGYQWHNLGIEAGIDNVLDKHYYEPLGGAYMGQGRTMSMNKELGNASNWGTPVAGAGRSLYVGVNYQF